MRLGPIDFMTSFCTSSTSSDSIRTASSTISVDCGSRCRAAASAPPRARRAASPAGGGGGRRCRARGCRRRTRHPRCRRCGCRAARSRSRAGSPTRRPCQPSTPVTAPAAARNESAPSEPLMTVGGNCQRPGVLARLLPAAREGGGHEAGADGAVDEGDEARAGESIARVRGQAGIGDEAGGERVDGGDGLADRGGELDVDGRELHRACRRRTRRRSRGCRRRAPGRRRW